MNEKHLIYRDTNNLDTIIKRPYDFTHLRDIKVKEQINKQVKQIKVPKHRQ